MLLILGNESSHKEFLTILNIIFTAEGSTQYLSDEHLKQKTENRPIKPYFSQR
jgi:hypothetical protein